VVGRRGAQTRQRIVDETLRLFEEQGFHGTSVDAIARAAGTSRATLYQYFESKDQIFVELLEECGAALMRVVRRLGPLGPTLEGFDNLHWWLGEWAWVYDKYATMFAQWSSVDTTDRAVRPLVLGFLSSYNTRITTRLRSSGVEGMSPEDASLALTSLVHRFNYFRHRGIVPFPSVDEAVDGLAVMIQLMLFPETDPPVFVGLPAVTDVVPATSVPDAVALPVPPKLGPRAAATVADILSAGARMFAERGYFGTSVDDLVASAGFARATFYKYFDDKLDLLKRLTAECRPVADELAGELATVDLAAGDGALHRWLLRYVEFYGRYVGVFRAWVEGSMRDSTLVSVAERGSALMNEAARHVLSQVDRRYPLDLNVATAAFLAALDRLPEAIYEHEPDASPDRIAALMLQVFDRAMLNGMC
jgi:AcrR family transcriptional regulator